MLESLDHIALHERLRLLGGACPRCGRGAQRTRCDCGGSCPRCRLQRRSSIAAVEAARDPFRHWRGWRRDASLQQIRDGRAPAPYFTPGPALYRISVPKRSGGPYVYIGAQHSATRAPAARILEHHALGRGSAAERRLAQQIRLAPASSIRVQLHPLPANMPQRQVHMYEIWRQIDARPRPSDWASIRNTRTFENELDALFDTSL